MEDVQGRVRECEREDLWVTRNTLKAITRVCISRLIHLGRHWRTALTRRSPWPLFNVGYDNREGSWKPEGRESARVAGKPGGGSCF